jgi:hypothetical protein
MNAHQVAAHAEARASADPIIGIIIVVVIPDNLGRVDSTTANISGRVRDDVRKATCRVSRAMMGFEAEEPVGGRSEQKV